MICFAILVHKNAEVVRNQIENIVRYNPDSQVVLYNGGNDENFALELQKLTNEKNIFLCPYSQPMMWGRLGRVLLDIMTWTDENHFIYDYLVYLDSDNMCIRAGFENYLDNIMDGYDVIGIDMWIEDDPNHPKNSPGFHMWFEWRRWIPFFKTNYFIRTFNPNQTFRFEAVKLILANLNRPFIEHQLSITRTVALEEYLYVTIAVINGAKFRSYPENSSEYIRLGDPLSLEEVQVAHESPNVFFRTPS